MASCQFEKIKSVASTKAMLRHCDKDVRKVSKHTNQELDTSRTDGNLQYLTESYDEACEKFDARLEYLDSLDGQNKRKDRVVCFGINIPFPDGLDDASDVVQRKFTDDVAEELTARFGTENILGIYVHRDERHQYFDAERQTWRMSRSHMHVYVIPADANEKLNGKAFSSRKNIIKLNDRVQEIAADVGYQFMDGSKRRNRHTVESLKVQSDLAEAKIQMQQQLQDAQAAQIRAIEVRLQKEYAEKFDKVVEERVQQVLERRVRSAKVSANVKQSISPSVLYDCAKSDDKPDTWEDILKRSGQSTVYQYGG